MPNGRLEEVQNILESNENQADLNHFWNNPDYKILIENQELSLQECYDKIVERSENIFKETRKVALEQIPEGKYILYINSTIEGVIRNKNIKYIDKERLEKMYQSETGNPEIDPENFQERNISYCLGLTKEDKRLKAINLFKEEIPTDLSDCVGIVFSGSEADITDEVHIERIEMTNKAKTLVQNSKKLNIPKLGICFGAQLLANEEGANIEWILDKEGNKVKITGMNEILKKDVHKSSYLPIEFNSSVFYVAKNHSQRIKKESLPSDAEVVAESGNGEVEIVYFPHTNIICTQFHPEVNAIRLNISESINNPQKDTSDFFIKNIEDIRSEIFPGFLKIVGNYAKNSIFVK